MPIFPRDGRVYLYNKVMPRNPNGRILLLFVGDLIAFYASLLLALLIRGGGTLQVETIEVHLMPFSMIFLGFLLCLYLAGLYDIRRFRGGIDLLKTVALALSIGAIIAIVFFYFVPDICAW